MTAQPDQDDNPHAAAIARATRALEDAVRMVCAARPSGARRAAMLEVVRESAAALAARMRAGGEVDPDAVRSEVRRLIARTVERHDGSRDLDELCAVADAGVTSRRV